MSILKGTNRGTYAPLTPELVRGMGYKRSDEWQIGGDWNFYKDQDHYISYNTSKKDFYAWIAIDKNGNTEQYNFPLKTPQDIFTLEKFWFSKDPKERAEAIEKILKTAVSLFGTAQRVFAKTIAADLVPVQPMDPPTGKIAFFDAPIISKPASPTIIKTSSKWSWSSLSPILGPLYKK